METIFYFTNTNFYAKVLYRHYGIMSDILKFMVIMLFFMEKFIE